MLCELAQKKQFYFINRITPNFISAKKLKLRHTLFALYCTQEKSSKSNGAKAACKRW